MANPFSNTVKFLKAVNLLASPRGTTLRELGDCLGISRRSVFRLLNAIGELDFPLDDNLPQSKSGKTYRLLETYVIKLPNIAVPNPYLTAREIRFLLAMLDVCERRNLADEMSMLKSARGKLTAMIPFEGN